MDGVSIAKQGNRRPAAPLAAILLAWPLVHLAALLLVPAQAKPLSFAFLILAPLAAALACGLRARRRRNADGWIALALAMLLWASGMTVNMCADLLLADAGPITGLSILFYVLYGVPLTFLVASPARDPWPARLVDGLLAAALGWIFWVHTFTFATITDASAEGVLNLRLMFDIQNLFVLLFALVRHRASTDPQRRALFGTLALFAGAYLLVAGYINHFQMEADFGQLPDVLIGLPFLLLAWLALRPAPSSLERRRASSPRFSLLVHAGSPLMLPLTLLAVSGPLISRAPGLAVGGFIAALLGYGLRNILVQMRSFDERDRLTRLSRIDALTGLANRRQFDETLLAEWNRARRSGTPIALALIDIDHFKQLNDGLGHPVGDARLRSVAEALAATATRGGDLVARYGGEEFAAILPGIDANIAADLAERMRRDIAGLGLASPAPGGIVTVSIGLAALVPDAASEPAELLAMADSALYGAKRSGRNAVMQWQVEAPAIPAPGPRPLRGAA